MTAAEEKPPAWETEHDAIEMHFALHFLAILELYVNLFTYFAQK